VAVDVADTQAVEEALSDASITVLATPVSAIIATLPQALKQSPVVTDCGSTKTTIVDAALPSPRRGAFVPGHPMAGGVHGGVEHARVDLFESRSWFLCPEGSDENAVALVEDLVRAVGATPHRLSPEVHDAAVARASHLPQLVASALAVVSERAGACRAGGPAFERMTRGAGGPDAMWADIFSANSSEVVAAVDELVRVLQSATSGLAKVPPDVTSAVRLLAEARRR
jgi:prephenate dehydrogenase